MVGDTRLDAARRSPWRSAGLTAVLGLSAVGLVGCGADVDTTPVPTEAEAPFVCTGVPRDGVRLISGVDEFRVSEGTGGWDDSEESFACVVKTVDGDGVVSISRSPVVWHDAETAEDYLSQFEGSSMWVPIEAEGPGAGYAAQETEASATAQWACGEDRVVIDAFTLAGGDRDPVADVSRLMVSLLPWACGDAEAPERTERG